MTWKQKACLGLILACLAQAGCASAARRSREAEPDEVAQQGAGADQEHADLERELSLYSD